MVLRQRSAPFWWIVNGRSIEPVAPLAMHGNVPFVPARQLADWLGGRLDWQPGESEARLYTAGGEVVLTLRPGERAALVKGRLVFFEAPAEPVGEEILAPAWVVAAALGAGSEWDASARALVVMRSELSGTVIALDPGHGGADPGGRGLYGLVESEVNWEVARRLGRLLTLAGAEVVWTRGATTGATIAERLAVIARPGLNAFLSLHHNTAADERVEGTETYYYPGAPDAPPHAAVPGVPSRRRLAVALQAELTEALGTRDRGARQAAFHLLREARVPGVRCEALFLTHPGDAALMRSPGGSLVEALALFRGLRAALSRSEG